MALAGRKVLLLAADDFENIGLLYPLYRLAEEEITVIVAGLDEHPVRGKKGHGPVAVDAGDVAAYLTLWGPGGRPGPLPCSAW